VAQAIHSNQHGKKSILPWGTPYLVEVLEKATPLGRGRDFDAGFGAACLGSESLPMARPLQDAEPTGVSRREEMSNLFLNWRVGRYHLQIGRDRPWVRVSRNSYWDGRKPSPWFERL
jgi:hypothetical protein